METNSKKVMEAMPSFEKFLDLAEDIKKLSLAKMKLENKIKSLESDNFKVIMTNTLFFVGGKPVAVSYYDNAYKFTGIEDNLVSYRNDLAETQAELELKKSEFEIYKSMMDLFKVLVYQEKALA
jgi:hypothetical protein